MCLLPRGRSLLQLIRNIYVGNDSHPSPLSFLSTPPLFFNRLVRNEPVSSFYGLPITQWPRFLKFKVLTDLLFLISCYRMTPFSYFRHICLHIFVFNDPLLPITPILEFVTPMTLIFVSFILNDPIFCQCSFYLLLSWPTQITFTLDMECPPPGFTTWSPDVFHSQYP